MEKGRSINFRSILVLLVLGGGFMVSCKKNISEEVINPDVIQVVNNVNKHDKENTEEETKILSGELRIGHELRAFTPCWSDTDYWVLDSSGELLKVYQNLTKGANLYTPIFVEIEVIDRGRSIEGFSADYEGVFEVVRILESRVASDVDCE